jgi:hypothetical protein
VANIRIPSLPCKKHGNRGVFVYTARKAERWCLGHADILTFDVSGGSLGGAPRAA